LGKESDEYRTEMIRHLQQEDQKSPPSEVLEAQKMIAKFEQRKRKREEQMVALQQPLPNKDACPKCYWLHGGIASIMRPQPSGDHSDWFRCPECGFEQERPE
jgi:predicted RNA-binding Zn-ribbon protein involved in translation (DUF1610 family)